VEESLVAMLECVVPALGTVAAARGGPRFWPEATDTGTEILTPAVTFDFYIRARATTSN
jgi:hypothetical protein